MLWSIRYRLLCWLLRLLVPCGLDELDLETVVLHYQLKVLQRGGRRVLFTTADRAFLAAAARVLSRHRWKSFLVGPDTLARWHRDLLNRRTGRGSRRPGRPPLDPSIKHLVLRLGRENPRWGYLRIRGELLKLAIDVSGTTIATVLREGGLGPAPRRIGPTWTEFLRLQAYGLLSPGAPPEKQGLQDLRSGPEALSEAGTNETDEPIDVDPAAPKSAAVHPRPRALLRTACPREGPRARDGPAIAADRPGDRGTTSHRSRASRRPPGGARGCLGPDTRHLVWKQTYRIDTNDSAHCVRSSFFTPHHDCDLSAT